MTNGERIKNMNVEELADILELRDCTECPMFKSNTSSCITMCREAFIEWLKQEATENVEC